MEEVVDKVKVVINFNKKMQIYITLNDEYKKSIYKELKEQGFNVCVPVPHVFL